MKKTTTYELFDKLGFGKYKHLTLKQVLDSHSGYIEWCLCNIPGFTLSDEAWNYAVLISQRFVAIRPKPSPLYAPYSDGVEQLLFYPWKKQYLQYMRTCAEDVEWTSFEVSEISQPKPCVPHPGL
ncbi:MAG: hypothetical protein IJ650_07210 [Paludibacteraceae bacterium]|nr:hypothetical protein [Paludibacteraceae bacterium]